MSEEKDIAEIKSEEKKGESSPTVVAEPRRRRRRRQSPSLFGPLLLIAVGVYFLLRNLGVELPEPNWNAALRLWPLLLVFIGLNIIVRQVRAPVGTALSALVTVGALGVFGYGLFGAPLDFLPEAETRVEAISHLVDGATSAEVFIDFNSAGGQVRSGAAETLLGGTVSTTGDVIFDQDPDGDRTELVLDTRSSGFFWLGGGFNLEPWDLTLSPALPLDLRFDISSGAVDLDLAELQLTSLDVDGSSGSMEVVAPAGTYPFTLDMSSGAATVALASGSDIDLEIDMSSGRLVLLVPDDLPVRVEVDGSSGAFDAGRLELVEGDRDDGIWESADYDPDGPGLTVELEMSSGSVSIREP